MAIPVRRSCDAENPREHVLWALVAMGGQIPAPLLFPRPVMEDFSEHLYRCGFRHHPELQTRHYQPPESTDSIWGAAGGVWVDDEEVDA